MPESKSLRLLLIGNYAPDRQESMLRFAGLMERELRARGHDVTLLQPAVFFGRLPLPGKKWLGYADKFLLFPFRLRAVRSRYDVVHICDHSNAMYVPHLGRTPHIVTCHDVLAIRSALGEIPQNPVSRSGRFFQRLILSGLRAARFTVCVSEATRTDLLRVTGGSPARASVVYLSLNYPYKPMSREEALAQLDRLGFDGRSPFFVHVGATVWYKNKLGLLQIFEQLTHKPGYAEIRLLTVGNPLDAETEAFVTTHGLSARVARIANISNEDLRAVYALAEALIFPSLQEGFGWPVIEAQACGCAVFATRKAPMTELGGTAAVYFDPSEPAQAATLIAGCLQDPESIWQAGLENAQRFSVDNLIDGYLAAYNQALYDV